MKKRFRQATPALFDRSAPSNHHHRSVEINRWEDGALRKEVYLLSPHAAAAIAELEWRRFNLVAMGEKRFRIYPERGFTKLAEFTAEGGSLEELSTAISHAIDAFLNEHCPPRRGS